MLNLTQQLFYQLEIDRNKFFSSSLKLSLLISRKWILFRILSNIQSNSVPSVYNNIVTKTPLALFPVVTSSAKDAMRKSTNISNFHA